jgi:hypothetical protein
MRILVAASSLLVLLSPIACDKDEPARWRYTCGDPVCLGYAVKPGVALCTIQTLGGRCRTLGATCDPRDECNRLLVCSVEDPGLVPCPDLP